MIHRLKSTTLNVEYWMSNGGLDPKLKEKLTIRAMKSEEDVKANRLFNKEEVIRRSTPAPIASQNYWGSLQNYLLSKRRNDYNYWYFWQPARPLKNERVANGCMFLLSVIKKRHGLPIGAHKRYRDFTVTLHWPYTDRTSYIRPIYSLHTPYIHPTYDAHQHSQGNPARKTSMKKWKSRKSLLKIPQSP